MKHLSLCTLSSKWIWVLTLTMTFLAPCFSLAQDDDIDPSASEASFSCSDMFEPTKVSSDYVWAMDKLTERGDIDFSKRFANLNLKPFEWVALLDQLIKQNKGDLIYRHLAILPIPIEHKLQFAFTYFKPLKHSLSEPLETKASFLQYSREQRVEIAYALIHPLYSDTDTRHVRRDLYRSLRLTQDEMAEVFIRSVRSKNPLSLHFHDYSHGDPLKNVWVDEPNLLADMFIAMAEVGAQTFQDHLNKDTFNDKYTYLIHSLNPEKRLEFLADLAIHHNQKSSSLTLSFLEPIRHLLKRDDVVHILKKAALTFADNRWRYESQYPQRNANEFIRTLSDQERKDVLVYVIKHSSREAFFDDHKETLDTYIQWWLDDSFIQYEDEISQALFRRAPITTMARYFNMSRGEFLDLYLHDRDNLSLTEALQTYSKTHPNLLLMQLVEIFLENVHDTRVVRQFIQYYFEHLSRRGLDYHSDTSHWIPLSSLQLLAVIGGLDEETLNDSALKDQPGQLYPLVLDIQGSRLAPAFDNIPIAKEVFDRRHDFFDFLSELRNYLYLLGRNQASWNQIVTQLNLQAGVTAENLEELTQKIEHLVMNHIQQMFRSWGESETPDFTYEQFQTLMSEWGDIDPIITLMARLAGKERWHAALPPLLKVLETSLNGSFKEYKFGNLSRGGHEQLSMIDPERVHEWAKNRYRLTLLSDEPGDNLPARVSYDLKQVLSTDLAPHFRALRLKYRSEDHLPSDVTQALKSSIGLLLSGIMKANPLHKVKEWVKETENYDFSDRFKSIEQQEEVIATYLLHMSVDGLIEAKVTANPQELIGWARVGFGLMMSYPNIIKGDDSQHLLSDFKAIEQILRANQSERASEGVVFSVLASDPKWLLTSGSLVNTSSCQNYRTGGMIHTLLGDVIDANVQIMASFHLTEKNFVDRNSYEQLVKALANQEPIQIGWNGNLMVANFKLGQLSHQIATKPLSKAQLRQTVKVGRILDESRKTRAGIRLEREYLQAHPALETMRKNHHEIFAELSEAIDAYNGSPVIMAASRNPLGVWSDLCRSSKTSDYEVP